MEQPFAPTLVRLQQGAPAPATPPEGELPRSTGDAPPPPTGIASQLPEDAIRTDALAIGEAVEPLIPLADQLERDLLARIEAKVPLARWWPFPDGAAGAVAITYEAAGRPGTAGWLARADRAAGVDGTLFASAAERSPEELAALRRLLGGVELLWLRGADDRYDRVRWGLDLLQPFWRPALLGEQRSSLARLAGSTGAPTLSRSAGGVWEATPSRTFRTLEAAGIQADSSYGPQDGRRAGYLFGTGLPFHPLDDDGLPFRLFEVPFLFRSDGRYDAELQETLLRRSAAGDHQLIVGAFPTDFMVRAPHVKRLEAWLALGAAAKTHQHTLLPLPRYLEHYSARLASPLPQRWDEAANRLTATPTVRAAGLTLALTARSRDAVLIRVTIDGVSLPEEGWLRRANTVLVPLGVGRHEITATYGKKRP